MPSSASQTALLHVVLPPDDDARPRAAPPAFGPNDPRLPPEHRFDAVNALGKGRHGVVEACRRRSDGRLVAVKTCDAHIARHEVQLLARAKGCVHVVALADEEDIAVSNGTARVCMQYCGSCTVYDFLQGKHASVEATPHACRRVLLGVCRALAHLHALRIAHRDVKAENVVLDDFDAMPRLVDFGLAYAYRDGQAMDSLTDRSGSLGYAAPEVVGYRGPYDGTRGDMWSFGVLAFILVVRKMPFHVANAADDSSYARFRRIQLYEGVGSIEALRRVYAPHTLHADDPTDAHAIDATLRVRPAERATAKQLLPRLDEWESSVSK